MQHFESLNPIELGDLTRHRDIEGLDNSDLAALGFINKTAVNYNQSLRWEQSVNATQTWFPTEPSEIDLSSEDFCLKNYKSIKLPPGSLPQSVAVIDDKIMVTDMQENVIFYFQKLQSRGRIFNVCRYFIMKCSFNFYFRPLSTQKDFQSTTLCSFYSQKRLGRDGQRSFACL